MSISEGDGTTSAPEKKAELPRFPAAEIFLAIVFTLVAAGCIPLAFLCASRQRWIDVTGFSFMSLIALGGLGLWVLRVILRYIRLAVAPHIVRSNSGMVLMVLGATAAVGASMAGTRIQHYSPAALTVLAGGIVILVVGAVLRLSTNQAEVSLTGRWCRLTKRPSMTFPRKVHERIWCLSWTESGLERVTREAIDTEDLRDRAIKAREAHEANKPKPPSGSADDPSELPTLREEVQEAHNAWDGNLAIYKGEEHRLRAKADAGHKILAEWFELLREMKMLPKKPDGSGPWTDLGEYIAHVKKRMENERAASTGKPDASPEPEKSKAAAAAGGGVMSTI